MRTTCIVFKRIACSGLHESSHHAQTHMAGFEMLKRAVPSPLRPCLFQQPSRALLACVCRSAQTHVKMGRRNSLWRRSISSGRAWCISGSLTYASGCWSPAGNPLPSFSTMRATCAFVLKTTSLQTLTTYFVTSATILLPRRAASFSQVQSRCPHSWHGTAGHRTHDDACSRHAMP